MTTTTATRQPALAEVQHAEANAAALHAGLVRPTYMPRATMTRLWQHFTRRLEAARRANAGTMAQLAIVQECQAALQAIAQLEGRDLATLCERDTMIARTGYQPALAAAADAIIAAHPLLASAFAAIAEEDAERAALIEAGAARQRAEAEHRAPAEILTRLRASNIALGVDAAGNLTAPSGAILDSADREQIARFKPGLVALLKAEAEAAAEAARPAVIA
jgi:hypothetical protein